MTGAWGDDMIDLDRDDGAQRSNAQQRIWKPGDVFAIGGGFYEYKVQFIDERGWVYAKQLPDGAEDYDFPPQSMERARFIRGAKHPATLNLPELREQLFTVIGDKSIDLPHNIAVRRGVEDRVIESSIAESIVERLLAIIAGDES